MNLNYVRNIMYRFNSLITPVKSVSELSGVEK